MNEIICDRIIENNLIKVCKRIAHACERQSRDPSMIQIVAVTKFVEISRIQNAISCGLHIFAENYVQEAKQKFSEIRKLHPNIFPHFIGYLQRNKVKDCLLSCSMIQSVDRWEIAYDIQTQAKEPVKILVQVRLGDEPTKHGYDINQIDTFIEKLSTLDKIEICGLMGIPPYNPDPEKSRPYYRKLYKTFLNARCKPYITKSFFILSMGMSNDFDIAIEEGSNMIRIGTALFGPRPNKGEPIET